MNFFEQNAKNNAPLADRMRPENLDEFIGQQHIVGKGKLLRRAIEADQLTSSIFYGPPGCGKTTLATVIANLTHSRFEKVNAVTTGVKEVREIIARAKSDLEATGKSTYLLLDECHRWSKAQSDSILPALEKGYIKFIGSTTENPLVAMTSAIVSRCRIFQFLPLTVGDVTHAMYAALQNKEKGFGNLNINIDDKALAHIAHVANGDARQALNALELAVLTTSKSADGSIHIDLGVAEESIQTRAIRCGEDEYYDMLSAFCKSLRGSSSDGALFWCFRMIYAGVDPRIIVRRMIAHASEDVGLANPQALVQAVAAMQALEFNGMPEAALNISQAIIYICESPKSNSVCTAMYLAQKAAKDAYQTGVPLHLRDTNYKHPDLEDSGKGYKYAHDFPGHYVEQKYLPDEIQGAKFFMPNEQGHEKNIKAAKEKRENL